ncbi:MAG: TonB-dependent receptor [Ignavibacteriae bacterium]|nr:TonB-dependent receptor [Ignavibacteriota bacterium]MCB9214309.1 TonB-dependent receptor [Ignavibacteria bacterium]
MTQNFRSYTLATLLFFALSLPEMLTAQPGRGGMMPSGSLVGTIVADNSGEPIPGATLAIWNSLDSTLVTGAASKVDGTIAIEGLRPGSFYLKITALGFLPKVVPSVEITGGALKFDFGTVRMEADEAFESEGVTLRGERADIEFRSDRTVYNVANQPVTSGGNAIDVLKTVPQIEVDINDNVSLRGSQNVAVHINDRPVPISGDALAAFLKSLPADMVKSVEVIPNPSAKYDPDGMAGIINIVLETEKDHGGVSGSVNLSAGTGDSYSATGSLNWRQNKLSLFSSYSFRYNEWNSDGVVYRENRILDPVNLLNQAYIGNSLNRSHVLNTTLDYGFDDMNSLSLTALVSTRSGLGGNSITYASGDVGSVNIDTTVRNSPSKDNGLNMDYTLGYRWAKESSNHEFSAEVRYFSDNNEGDGSYVERLSGELANDSVVQRQVTETQNKNFGTTFRLDYIRPIGEKGRIETGYKGDLTRINNTYYSESFDPKTDEFQPDVELNNEFVYDEHIHAAYAIYNHQFGSLEAQVGLRAEQALTDFNLKTTGETFENNYFSLFPSASASYALGQTTRVRASYSRRINRPGVWRLNPFTQYEDRLNLRTGNPYLRPEYVDAIELGLNKFTAWGSLSFSPYYRHSTDLIERWLTIDSNGVSTVSWENFATTDSYGAEFVGTFRVKDRLRGFANLSLYQFDLNGSNIESDLTNNAFGWSASANMSLTILSWLDFQTNYFYRAPIKISRGEITAMQSLDGALKATFLEKKASLSLRVSDIFNTMKFDLFRDDPNYYIEVDRKWLSQRATLTFSWNFGQQDQSGQRRRQRRDDGESQGGGTPAGVGF